MADLYEITFPAKKDTVKYLEDLLARAKTGSIQGFAVVILKNNAVTANGWTGVGMNPMSIIGEIEAMKVDMIRANVNQRFDCYGDVMD